MGEALQTGFESWISGKGEPDLEGAVMMAMSLMTQARHHETGQHIVRTQHYVRELAKALIGHPFFTTSLDIQNIDVICKAAALHDIGKVGVPDRILLKTEQLTQEEFEEMKRHTVYGRDTIMAAKQKIRAPKNFLRAALDIAYCHHEKWNGTGYPEGLSGEAIPLSARLMAIADVYDALISARPYKKALSHTEAMWIITSKRGSHFDPELVDALENIHGRFAVIATQLADS